MLGNFVTGASVLVPSGMLSELSADLGVSVARAALLITFGAIVLFVGSPLTAWLTSSFDRRRLLSITLLIMACTHVASAFAPNYASLLAIRLVMLGVGALFTPQAASTVAVLVPLEKRGGTMSYVFMGWSLAAAFALPAIAYVSSHYGWRYAHGGIAAIAFLSFVLVAWRLPSGHVGVPVALRTWGELARNRLVMTLLLITTLYMSGQFVIFTFLGPLLVRDHIGAEGIAVVFLAWGVMGFIGNLIASRIVDSWGAWNTSITFTASLLTGLIVWALSGGNYAVVLVAIVLWGLGFAAINSMQQVRLVTAAPALSSASVSLNTSAIYVGQAVGSAVGSFYYVRDAFGAMSIAAVGFIVVTITLIALTRPRRSSTLSPG